MFTHDEKIQKLEAELTELKREKELIDNMPEEKRLALLLHEKYCRTNHTDGCAWHYEVSRGVHNWNGYTHERWCKYAIELLEQQKQLNLTQEQLLKVVDIAQGLR